MTKEEMLKEIVKLDKEIPKLRKKYLKAVQDFHEYRPTSKRGYKKLCRKVSRGHYKWLTAKEQREKLKWGVQKEMWRERDAEIQQEGAGDD